LPGPREPKAEEEKKERKIVAPISTQLSGKKPKAGGILRAQGSYVLKER